MTNDDLPQGLFERTMMQRSRIAQMKDMYALLVAHQLLIIDHARLAATWRHYQGQLDLDLDPIVALATRIVIPVREAKRRLAAQGGDIEGAKADLRQFLCVADVTDPMVPIVRDALDHLIRPDGLNALFSIAVPAPCGGDA